MWSNTSEKKNISKLQSVQNFAARIITKTRKFDHITPALGADKTCRVCDNLFLVSLWEKHSEEVIKIISDADHYRCFELFCSLSGFCHWSLRFDLQELLHRCNGVQNYLCRYVIAMLIACFSLYRESRLLLLLIATLLAVLLLYSRLFLTLRVVFFCDQVQDYFRSWSPHINWNYSPYLPFNIVEKQLIVDLVSLQVLILNGSNLFMAMVAIFPKPFRNVFFPVNFVIEMINREQASLCLSFPSIFFLIVMINW